MERHRRLIGILILLAAAILIVGTYLTVPFDSAWDGAISEAGLMPWVYAVLYALITSTIIAVVDLFGSRERLQVLFKLCLLSLAFFLLAHSIPLILGYLIGWTFKDTFRLSRLIGLALLFLWMWTIAPWMKRLLEHKVADSGNEPS